VKQILFPSVSKEIRMHVLGSEYSLANLIWKTQHQYFWTWSFCCSTKI